MTAVVSRVYQIKSDHLRCEREKPTHTHTNVRTLSCDTAELESNINFNGATSVHTVHIFIRRLNQPFH